MASSLTFLLVLSPDGLVRYSSVGEKTTVKSEIMLAKPEASRAAAQLLLSASTAIKKTLARRGAMGSAQKDDRQLAVVSTSNDDKKQKSSGDDGETLTKEKNSAVKEAEEQHGDGENQSAIPSGPSTTTPNRKGSVDDLSEDDTGNENKSKAKRKRSSAQGSQKRKKREMKDPNSYKNSRVAKFFGKELYYGSVSAVIPATRTLEKETLWKIVYDDGDKEDYTEKELMKHLRIYKHYEQNDDLAFRSP